MTIRLTLCAYFYSLIALLFIHGADANALVFWRTGFEFLPGHTHLACFSAWLATDAFRDLSRKLLVEAMLPLDCDGFEESSFNIVQ